MRRIKRVILGDSLSKTNEGPYQRLLSSLEFSFENSVRLSILAIISGGVSLIYNELSMTFDPCEAYR